MSAPERFSVAHSDWACIGGNLTETTQGRTSQ